MIGFPCKKTTSIYKNISEKIHKHWFPFRSYLCSFDFAQNDKQIELSIKKNPFLKSEKGFQ